MVRSYPDMSVRVIQYAPYRITFCLYFRMEIDLVPFRFYVFCIETMQLIALIWIKKDINMSLWKLLVDMYGPAGVFISLYLLPSCLNKSD